MSTKLESLIIRESTEIADDRNILIALTPDQRISFRLKGMKSGVVSIPIKELYEQLSGTVTVKKGPVSTIRKEKNTDEPMISLNRLRTLNATTPAKVELLARMDELLVDLIDEVKTEK